MLVIMRSILLVEDHEDSGRLLAMLLRTHNYGIQWVRTELDALHELRSKSYDVIISDVGLGHGGCGLSLLRRARSEGIDCPAIALSGYGLEEDYRATREAGFQHHVLKPVDLDGLLKLLSISRRSDAEAGESDGGPMGKSAKAGGS